MRAFQQKPDGARPSGPSATRTLAQSPGPELAVTSRGPRFSYDFSRLPVLPGFQTPPQTEYDSEDVEPPRPAPVPERVTRIPAQVQRACACDGKSDDGECDSCKLARKARGEFAGGMQAPSVVSEVLRSPGRPLDQQTRKTMADRFQFDFGRVRVHDDALAARSASAVSALAYTVGRDIAFAAGQYSPGTVEGRRLLAHELTHVVQQHGSAIPSSPALTVAPADGPGESEADATAEAVLRGHPVAPRRLYTGDLHRKMHNKAIQEPLRSNAKACLVHLHGEEHTAAAVAQELYGRRCVNYVHLDTDKGPLSGLNQRYLEFDVDVDAQEIKRDKSIVQSKVNYTCMADPNRVFSDKGRQQTVNCRPTHGDPAPKKVKPTDITTAAAGDVKTFVDSEWGKGISQCRNGPGTADLAGPLAVLALHNNEGADPILNRYKGQWAPQTDPRLKGGPNPDYSADPGNKSDVFFVADPPSSSASRPEAPDFDAVKGTYNVGLQAQPVPSAGEDGSLSVALQDQRFINVEKLGRDHDKLVNLGSGFQGHDAVYIKNYAMAVKALDVLNVPEGPCLAATPSAPAQTQQTDRQGTSPTGSQPAPPVTVPTGNQPVPPVAAPTGSAGGQKTDDESRKTEPYPRDKVDDKDVPPGCLHFEPATIGARKSYWTGRIASLPVLDVANWIVGAWSFDAAKLGARAPGIMPEVVNAGVGESFSQRSCLLKAMQAGVKSHGGKVPSGDLMASGSRSFSDQKRIWEDKWSFAGTQTFDRISDNAATRSRGLLTAGEKWDPTDPIHKLMWGVVLPTNTKDPNVDKFLKAGATALTPQEREKEILMASSAPGVSRHHAGTDFDIGQKGTGKDELEPELWKAGEKYFDAGRWLLHNAAAWGFMRPFETKGGYGRGYMAEPWHWSYWPVAQALLEFARTNQKDVESILREHWQDASKKALPQFEFIWGNWKSFLENVDQTPRF